MSVYMRSGKYVCLRPQFIAERCALSIHDLILRSADYCSLMTVKNYRDFSIPIRLSYLNYGTILKLKHGGIPCFMNMALLWLFIKVILKQ